MCVDYNKNSLANLLNISDADDIAPDEHYVLAACGGALCGGDRSWGAVV